MKNDYLFDGTGQDAEIERLEDLLSGYRYAETDPPELPAMNVIPVGRAAWRPRFGWILAFGATAAALLLVAVFMRFGGPAANSEIATENAPIQLEQQVSKEPTPPVQPPVTTATDTKGAEQTPRAVFAKAKVRKPLRATVAKHRTVKLTDEELYAYNQVKLALFITSAKLRTVSDTIDRAETKQDRSPKNIK